MGNSYSLSEPHLRDCANVLLQAPNVEEAHLVDMSSFHRVRVSSDGSCLFTAVSNILKSRELNAPALRQIVRSEIERDPVHYTAEILGMPRRDYMNWIMKPSSWGGYIELTILANYLKIRLVAIDIQTLCPHHFPDPSEAERVQLMSGVDRGLQVQAMNISNTEVKKTGKESFVLYHVEMRMEDGRTTTIKRRYKQIYELDAKLRKIYPRIGAKFPKKTYLNNLDHQFIQERRVALNLYFSHLLSAGFPISTPEFKAFLLGSDVPPSLRGDAGCPADLFFSHTGFLLHDGVHYDLVAARSFRAESQLETLTLFPPEPCFLDAALSLARNLRHGRGASEGFGALSRGLVDADESVLECERCRAAVKGQGGARAHAAATGHVHFAEVFRLAQASGCG